MRTSDAALEASNYENDHRVRAANRRDGLTFNERAMTLSWLHEVDVDATVPVPAFWRHTPGNTFIEVIVDNEVLFCISTVTRFTKYDWQDADGGHAYDIASKACAWINAERGWVDDSCSEERETVFPARYEVCGTCGGKGSHVNPSIDAGGISEDEDFWADDCDEDTGESRYMRGDYDVPCYECHGRRVSPVIDEARANKADLAAYEEHREDEYAYEAECRAERRMGC